MIIELNDERFEFDDLNFSCFEKLKSLKQNFSNKFRRRSKLSSNENEMGLWESSRKKNFIENVNEVNESDWRFKLINDLK